MLSVFAVRKLAGKRIVAVFNPKSILVPSGHLCPDLVKPALNWGNVRARAGARAKAGATARTRARARAAAGADARTRARSTSCSWSSYSRIKRQGIRKILPNVTVIRDKHAPFCVLTHVLAITVDRQVVTVKTCPGISILIGLFTRRNKHEIEGH